jgi:hypothetical protein
MPQFKRLNRTEITGSRTRHVLTFNPNSASPGEDIYVNIPKLKSDSLLVPDSMCLVFNFKNKNTKSWFLNNLSKQLQKRLVIRFAGQIVYDNSGESLLETYRDLWLTNDKRDDMVEEGIATEAVRKAISKDDASTPADDSSAAILSGIYGTKQKITIGKILKDHGLYAPHNMISDLQYIITLPPASEIMVAQSSESVEGYTLENIELEYESIDNAHLARKSEGLYGAGQELSFEHITLMKKSEWAKDTTIINETINLPRKSMKAIVMLFTKKTKKDSEEYVYPNIERVKVSIEGVPNSVYSQGIPKTRLFEEADRLFCRCRSDRNMTLDKFYRSNKFALAIDLRAASDSAVYGNGAKIQNTQSGIFVEITKKATTSDLMCHLFVLSDGVIRVTNGQPAVIKY